MTDQHRMSPAVLRARTEPADSLDDFPTPPWAVRALCAWLIEELGEDLDQMSVREPAANRGYMARALGEFFAELEASDIHDYGAGFPLADFLDPELELAPVDWTITNPPFNRALEFIMRALASSNRGVAMFVRSAYLEGKKRARFYAAHPPSYVLTFSERVVILRGRLVRAGAPDPSNINPKTGKPRKASSATSYSFVVWIPGVTDTRFRLLSSERISLERAGDYPELAA